MSAQNEITLGRILEKLEDIEQGQLINGARIAKLEDNLKAAIAVFRFLKYLGMGALALLTLNWANFAALLERFKNG